MAPFVATAPVAASVLGTAGVVILWILAVALGLLVALALLVVALPFHVRAEGAVEGFSARGEARFTFGWILLGVRLRPARATLHLLGLRIWTFRKAKELDEDEKERERAKKEKAKAKAKAKAEKAKAEGKKKRRPSLVALWLRRRTAWRLLGRVLGTFGLRARIRGVVGLGDPSETASLFQTLWALEGMLPGLRLEVEPDWLDEQLALEGEIRARLWLAHTGGVLLVALLKKDNRMLLRAVRATGA